MSKTYFTCTTRERLSLPSLYYKNIEKHELLVFQSSASKFKYDDTLRLRPPSSRPNYLIYIFSRPASIVFLHVEIIAPVSKGARNFRIRSSNPHAQIRELADAENHRADNASLPRFRVVLRSEGKGEGEWETLEGGTRHKNRVHFPSEVENGLLVITNRVETIGDERREGGGLCARELQPAQIHALRVLTDGVERMKRFLVWTGLVDTRWQTRGGFVRVHD